MSITITVNGERRSVPAATLLVSLISLPPGNGDANERRGIAVARNGEVVRRAEWDGVILVDGDAIEILKAAQGG